MIIKTEGLIKRGDRVAVALSGGADSIALFHALLSLEEELGIEVSAINVEHGIRGELSVADSNFVKELCNKLGKRILCFVIDVPKYADENKMGLEAAARELRYKCFFQAVSTGFCDKVATAHHSGDNAESVLLNVFRGSGTRGLKGISPVAYEGKVIRPLLYADKSQITAYIAQNQLDFVQDDSNFDESYTRNYIRESVLPLIKERYPEVETSLLRLGEIAREDDEYLTAIAKQKVSAKEGEARLKIDDSARPIFSRAIILAMKGAGLNKDYERAHVEAIIGLKDCQSGARVILPHGYVAERVYREIVIYKQSDNTIEEIPFNVGIYEFPKGVLSVEKIPCPKEVKERNKAFFAQNHQNGTLFITAKIPENAVIRGRREGDVIEKLGGGRKPLKEYLIDLKIERRLRDCLPVLAVKNNVLLIAGVNVGERAKVKKNEDEIYKITFKEHNK